MAKFRVTGPDGKSYEITAPDGASEQDIMSFVQKNAPAPDSGFAERAASMDPTDLSIARSKNDDFGAHLREEAKKPREGETEDQRNQRLYGGITSPEVGTGEGMARAALQGGTFGAGDEVVAAGAAGLNKLLGSDPDMSLSELYGQYLASERGKMGQFRDDSPVLAYGTEIAGAIPTALAAAGPAIGAAASMPARVGLGAATGATEGGIYGFNAGEGGAGERAKNAALSSGVGAIAGAAAPYAAKGAENLVSRVMAARAARQQGISRPTLDILRRTMSADDSLTGQGAQRIAAAGDDAMIADAGKTSRALLDTAVQRSGAAGRTAYQAVDDRVTNASQKLTNALDDAFGKPGESQSRALMVHGDKTNPLSLIYKKAYGTPIDYASDLGRRIETTVNRQVPQSAIDAANKLMRLEDEASKQIIARIADDGTVVFDALPDVRQLDYITRGLNAVAEAENGKGALGGTTQIGRAYSNLSSRLRGLLKEAVPEYKQALNMAAGKIRERQAREFGQQMLRSNVTRDQVSEALSGMGDAEKRKVGEGVRQYVDDMLANVKQALTDTNMDAREATKALKELTTRANREKITTLLGREKARGLYRDIDQASTALGLRASLADNSKTFARTAINDMVEDQIGGGVAGALRDVRTLDVAQQAAAAVLGKSAAARTAQTDKVYEEIARFLTERRGMDAQQAIRELEALQPAIDAGAMRLGRPAERAMRGNAGVTAPLMEAAQP